MKEMNKLKSSNAVLVLITVFFLVCELILCSFIPGERTKSEIEFSESEVPVFIYVGEKNLQEVIDSAPPFSTIVCNQNKQLQISIPVVINKPLTLRGLNARLPDKLGGISIIEVKSKNVTITDFELLGNASSVPQSQRAALITVYTGEFRIEKGLLKNSSKDGIEVDQREFTEPVVGGVIRDIVGQGCVRDVISLSGPAGSEPHIRNILVENIRGYDSSLRGTVEVSDGAQQITVRKIYAENCYYAVDIQDHNKQEINTGILINDVHAVRCTHAIRTANHANGHSNLIISNVTSVQCVKNLYVSNTSGVTIQNVTISDYNGDGPVMSVTNCSGLTIRDVTFLNCKSGKDGLLIQDCDDVTIDGVKLNKSNSLFNGVTFRLTTAKTFENLIISNVTAKNTENSGILLEKTIKEAGLNDYIITNNIARIDDKICGSNRLLSNNINSD